MTQETTHTPDTRSNIMRSKLIRFPALVAPATTVTRLPVAMLVPRPDVAQPQSQPTAAPELVPGSLALAHDAQNALTSLELLSGLLAEPGVVAAAHAGLATDVQQTVRRVAALVAELTAGRTDPPGSSTDPTAGCVHDSAPRKKESRPVGLVLTNSVRILELTAGASVQVYVSFESGLPAVAMADADLERVLVNLVKNASEAMPQGGTVRITARRALSRTAPAILLQVIDDGPGIPAHALEHIFKAGFSSKRGTRPWQVECGLGLTIVRQMVEGAGGRIRAASTLRRGATFEIRLPSRG